MPRHILYVYVDGSDLHAIAESLDARLVSFVDGSTWQFGVPRVINQQRRDDPTLGPDDLPDWELGLNLDLPGPPQEPPSWFSDVERIAQFFGELASEYSRDFVVGIGDTERGYSEDLFFIDSPHPDLQTLRRVVGMRAPA